MSAFGSFWEFFLKIFRKIGGIIWKKILILINPLIKKRLIKGLNRLITEGEKGKKIPPRLIWKVISTVKSLRQTGLRMFLTHSKLSLEDIFSAAENIPGDLSDEKKEELLNILWGKADEMVLLTEDLYEIIINGPLPFRGKAQDELEKRITNGDIREERAKKILEQLIDKVPGVRIRFSGLFMELNPSSDELKKLLNKPWMYSLPILSGKIQAKIRILFEEEKAEKKFEAGVEKKIENWLKKIS